MFDNKEGKIFTVVILHYNQNMLWRMAVRSVLNQKYPYIELVFADDCSKDFDKREVETFIQRYAGQNLVNYTVYSNKTNIGTVNNLNKAHQYCNGQYIIHFAADDCLYDEEVLNKYAIELDRKQEDVLGIYGRSMKCDRQLNVEEDYILVKEAQKYNTLTSQQQLAKLLLYCIFPMGATAFNFSELKQFLPFDNQYRLLEDWPFFLNACQQGKRFCFVDIPVLLYRVGGISRPDSVHISEARKQLFSDHLFLHENYIFNHTKCLSIKEMLQLLRKYDGDREYMQKILNNKLLIKRIRLIQKDIRFARVVWDNLTDEQQMIFGIGIGSVASLLINCLIVGGLWLNDLKILAAIDVIFYVIVFTLIYRCYSQDIKIEYEKLKYYLFSPYR